MFWHRNIALAAVAALSISASALAYEFGGTATPEEIKLWDIDIRPDGKGLPEGSGTVAQGKSVYTDNCAVCHSNEKGAPAKIGPNLFGVVGRKSATMAGYMYSPAMMKANLTWDVPTLQVYLMGPQKKVPGTKMGFPGFSDPKDEADVIAYLQTLK